MLLRPRLHPRPYIGSFIVASWIWLGHIAESRKKGKEKGRKPLATADLSQPLNAVWLDNHATRSNFDIYLNAVKQQIMCQKISPV